MRVWELDAYVGLIGAAFLAVFGLARQLWPSKRPDEPSYRELNIPIGLMTLFAIGSFYSPLFNLGLPLLNSERVTARFIIIPIVLLLMLACIRFQKWLPKPAGSTPGKLLTLECGIRFLTDYLQGDVYFKIKRPGHNIDRCRNQFAFVAAIERRLPEMEAIVKSHAR